MRSAEGSADGHAFDTTRPDDETTARARQMLTLTAAKWSLPVLEAIEDGTFRFNALQRRVEGISHRLLTVTLRRLCDENLIERFEYEEAVLHVEYHLTSSGRDLLATAHQFCVWTKQHPSPE